MHDSEDRDNLTAHSGVTWLLLVAAVLPAIVAYAILYRQAFPVPYQDDYKAILGFAVEYAHLPTFKAKVLHIATNQSNEYKLSFEHSIVASEVELTRHLHFPFLIALGDLFLVPILYLVWLIFQEDEPNPRALCKCTCCCRRSDPSFPLSFYQRRYSPSYAPAAAFHDPILHWEYATTLTRQ